MVKRKIKKGDIVTIKKVGRAIVTKRRGRKISFRFPSDPSEVVTASTDIRFVKKRKR